MTEVEKVNIDEQFRKVQVQIYRQFQKNPDLDVLLFLIGVRELGVVKDKFTKSEKVDLMHIATCRLLSEEGYYKLAGQDQEGWPHWEPIKALPTLTTYEQEYLLKKQIIRYFEAL